MKFNKQKTALVLLITILLIIPNFKTYPAVGYYNIKTTAIFANDHFETVDSSYKTKSFTAAFVAVAAAVSATYFAGFVIGRMAHYGYDMIGGSKLNGIAYNQNYKPMDFTTFDN